MGNIRYWIVLSGLGLNATLVFSGVQVLPVEDLKKNGAVQAIQKSLDDKFSVQGGTVSGGGFFKSSMTVSGPMVADGTITGNGSSQFNSSFTVQSGGRDIILSTSTVTNSIEINGSDGLISFYPNIHNSSVSARITGSFTNTTFGTCVSTLTITTSGNDVAVFFIGALDNDTQNTGSLLSFLQDGASISPMTSTIGVIQIVSGVATTGGNASFYYVVKSVSAGSHSYCLQPRVTAQTGSFEANTVNQFGVMELR